MMRLLSPVIALVLILASVVAGRAATNSCTLQVEISSDSPLWNYVAGIPYKLTLKLKNPTGQDVTIKSFVAEAKDYGDLVIDIEPVGDTPKSVSAGQAVSAEYAVVFPENAANRVVTLIGSADCCNGRATDYLPLLISPQLELNVLPSRLILDRAGGSQRVGMSIINHLNEVFAGRIALSVSGNLRCSPTEHEMKIDPYGLEAFVFQVEAVDELVPGHYAVYINLDEKTKDWLAVDVPVLAKRPDGKVVIDGKLDDWDNAAAVAIAKLIGESTWETIGKGRFAWDDSSLYLAVEVDDDNHFLSPDSKSRANANPPSDTIVIGLDPLINGVRTRSGGYKNDDCEITLCGAEGGSVALVTWAGGKSQETQTRIPVAFSRDDGRSCYEVAIPWSQIKSFKPSVNAKFAMSILVNDSDGRTVTQTEWGGGLAGKMDPRRFVPVVLR